MVCVVSINLESLINLKITRNSTLQIRNSIKHFYMAFTLELLVL